MPGTSVFHLILRTDVKDFSGRQRTKKDHADIRETEYEALSTALREIEVPWERCHVEDRGDGVLLIAPSGIDNALFANTVLHGLRKRVREHNAAIDRPGCRFKLRVAIDIGLVDFHENTVVSPSVTTVTRMVNSRRLKSELAKSKADLAAGVSHFFYEQVIQHASNVGEFRRRSFKCKNARGPMWVWPPYDYRPKRTKLITRSIALVFALLATWPFGQHGAPPASNSLLGAPARMADPCALVDSDALGPHGRVERDSDFGEFSKCDTFVRSGESKVYLKVQLRAPDARQASNTAEQERLTISARPPQDKECARMVTLPDGYRVEVNAVLKAGKADLCVISTATAQYAMNVLEARKVRRRAMKPGGSLFYADACTIIPDERLQLPEINAKKPVPDFGNWSCTWERSTTHPVSLTVAFDQSPMPNASDGRMIRIGDRDAIVDHNFNGDGACRVRIMYKPFKSVAGPIRVEALFIIVSGKLAVQQHCEIAKRVAGG